VYPSLGVAEAPRVLGKLLERQCWLTIIDLHRGQPTSTKQVARSRMAIFFSADGSCWVDAGEQPICRVAVPVTRTAFSTLAIPT
jgi:hypothetical protein